MTTTNATFQALYSKAHAAGLEAGSLHTPQPMYVRGYAPVMDGLCGFAWITLPGNTAFGRWAKAMGYASKAYPKGLRIRVRGFDQSMERKEAYAVAFAAALRDAGIEDVYAASRMD